MSYLITYRSDKPIEPGRCVDCPQHFANLDKRENEPSTGCGLSNELIPDEWNTEEKPWDKCPVQYEKACIPYGEAKGNICKYAIPGQRYRKGYQFPYKCAVMFECRYEEPTEEKAQYCPRKQIGDRKEKQPWQGDT